MTAPGNSLSAHEDHSLFRSKMQQFMQVFRKLLSLHVIRKAPEAEVSPTRVRRIMSGLSQSPKILEMEIANSSYSQGGGERVGVEVGYMARPGYCPHIDEQLDLVAMKDLLKLSKGPCGVTDSVNGL